jgi:hypothetical protein
MPTTMKLIAKNVLGSAAASIEFTSIPGTYTDLVIVASLRSARSTELDDIYMRINGVVTDRTRRSLYGTGSAAASESASNAYVATVNAANSTSNTFTSVEVYLPNYAGSTNKSLSAISAQEANSSTAYIFATAGLWSQTAAVTSVEFYSNNSQNIASGSSFFLYGITKA